MDPWKDFLSGKQILSGRNNQNVWKTEILRIGLGEIQLSPCIKNILT